MSTYLIKRYSNLVGKKNLENIHVVIYLPLRRVYEISILVDIFYLRLLLLRYLQIP